MCVSMEPTRLAACRDVVLMSFGKRNGPPPTGAVCYVDATRLQNPPRALRGHTGCNKELRRWVVQSDEGAVASMLATLRIALEESLRAEWAVAPERGVVYFASLCSAGKLPLPRPVALFICDLVLAGYASAPAAPIVLCVGCVAGRHRSVAVVEHAMESEVLALPRSRLPFRVSVVHRELGPPTQTHRPRGARGRANKRAPGKSKYVIENNDDD